MGGVALIINAHHEGHHLTGMQGSALNIIKLAALLFWIHAADLQGLSVGMHGIMIVISFMCFDL